MSLLRRACGPTAPGRTTSPLPVGDRGDVIVGWLVKLAVGLGALGVVGFDAISLGSTSISLEDQAVLAARSGSDALAVTPTAQAAYEAALTSAQEQDSLNRVDPAEVSVAPDGTVTVVVHRSAPTLLVRHVGPLRDWVDRSATATAAPLQ